MVAIVNLGVIPMLKLRYEKKEDIPAEYLALFTEKDGAWVLTQIEGIKTQADVNAVQEGLRKERDDHKDTKRKLTAFGDLNPEEVHAKLDRIDELEAAAGDKLDDTKINEMVESRIKTKVAPLERTIAALETESVEKDGVILGYQQKDTKRIIHDYIRKAATASKMRETAVDDALLYGEHIFEVNEQGIAVAKDKVGVTPGITADVWLSEIQQSRLHWWPESEGVGSRGGDGGGGGLNPWTDESWNMTKQGAIYNTDSTKAEQLAKSAGTTIGGPRPVTAPKK